MNNKINSKKFFPISVFAILASLQFLAACVVNIHFVPEKGFLSEKEYQEYLAEKQKEVKPEPPPEIRYCPDGFRLIKRNGEWVCELEEALKERELEIQREALRDNNS